MLLNYRFWNAELDETTEKFEILQFSFPSPQDASNPTIFCTPFFPHKLLQDVLPFHDFFLVDQSAYADFYRRTEQNPAAKLLLLMWSILFMWHSGEDVFIMLVSFYAKNAYHLRQFFDYGIFPTRSGLCFRNQGRNGNISASIKVYVVGSDPETTIVSGLLDPSSRNTVIVQNKPQLLLQSIVIVILNAIFNNQFSRLFETTKLLHLRATYLTKKRRCVS